jgi:hypothetical protein
MAFPYGYGSPRSSFGKKENSGGTRSSSLRYFYWYWYWYWYCFY